MIVRPADLERDALAIMDGARDFVSRMGDRSFLPETEDGLTEAVAGLVTQPFVEVTVAEHDGRVVGGIGFSLTPHIWNPRRLFAEELFWWAAPDAPAFTAGRLIRHVRARYRGHLGAMHALGTSPEGIHRLYRAMGFVPSSTAYLGVF